MRLGIVLAGVLAGRESGHLEYAQLCAWAAANGYRAVDVPGGKPELARTARAAGLEPCAIDGLPNLIVADDATRERNIAAAIAQVEAAAAAGVPLVRLEHPRLPGATDDETLRAFEKGYGPLVERAERLGVRLFVENYAAAGANFAISPHNWRHLLAAMPSPAFGLCIDPSHLVALGIDYLRAVYEFGPRIVYAHAKDTEVSPEGLYQHGYTGHDFGAAPGLGRRALRGEGWWRFTLPGQGVVDWGRYVAALREVGYDGVLAVEHEDDTWGWLDDVDLTLRGLAVSERFLSQFVA